MTIELALVFSAIGVIISVATYFKNNKKETKSDLTDMIELKTQLTYISRGVDDIKLADKAREKDIKTLSESLTQHNFDIKNIYRAIDKLEESVTELQKGGN